ncbi:MAG: hypothetical protein J6S86_01275 [Alphaproteobacteria bacterium]|nr:hypothetical protein [Alphaproteobacteria bacterium]
MNKKYNLRWPVFLKERLKKIILYKGTELIGAAEIVEVTPGRFSINFAWTNDNEKLLKKFSRTLEDWIKIRGTIPHF